MNTSPLSLPPIAIIDLDDTLTDTTHRRHYIEVPEGVKKEWDLFFDACGDDPVNEHILEVIRIYQEYDIPVGVFTGRPRRNEGITRAWLSQHQVDPALLLMRPDGCFDRDYVMKGRWGREVSQQYRLIAAYDDMDHNLQALAPYIEAGHIYLPTQDPSYLLEKARHIASTFGFRQSGFSLL